MPHTPGPWLYTTVDFDSCTMAIVAEDGSSIFDMTVTENTTGHNALFNNAGLVAAAPAMLEALRDAHMGVCNWIPTNANGWLAKENLLKKIDRAIRAATGEF